MVINLKLKTTLLKFQWEEHFSISGHSIADLIVALKQRSFKEGLQFEI